MADYTTLQDAVDGLRADNQAVTDEVLASNVTATTASTEAQAARDAAETAESNAKQSEILSLQYKDSAEAAVPLAEQHKLDAEAQVPLAQAEKVAAQAARDTTVLTALGPDNDKLAAIASVYGAPSLNLDFAKGSYWKQGTYPWNQDALDPAVDLTFTRATPKWVFDATGTLVEVPVDQMAIDHDPVTGESLGVLLEESRTNLWPNSNGFINRSGANGIHVSVESNQAGAPDGSSTAHLLRVIDGSYLPRIYAGFGLVTAGHTRSIFVKQAGSTPAGRVAVSSDGASGATFDFATESITESGGNTSDFGFQKLSSGWYRLYYTFGADTSGGNNHFITFPDRIVGEGVLVWGDQIEEGPYPTSYIPTAGAAATRAGDSLVAPLSNISDVYRWDEFSVFAEFHPVAIEYDTNHSVVMMSGDGPDWNLWSTASNNLVFSQTTDVGFTGGGTSGLANEPIKAAASSSVNAKSLRMAANGVSNSVGSVTPSQVLQNMTISGNQHGPIKKVALYPRAMTAAELVELTS